MIILTYGQPKSASTFLTYITKHACELQGSDQDAIKDRVLTGDLSQNKRYWFGPIAKIAKVTSLLDSSEILMIKTHAQLHDALLPGLRERKIFPFISYRNPGDAALSAFEAGDKARKAGDTSSRQDFYKLLTHRDAIEFMANHVNSTTIPWLKSGFGAAYSYQELTKSPENLLHKLSEVTGVELDRLKSKPAVRRLIKGEDRVYNFNKGVSGRHREVFSPADLAYLEERCGRFIRFCDGEIGIEQV